MKRLKVHGIDATGTPDGTTALHGDGTWKVPAAQLLPVTTEVNGVPELVWDDNNNLVYAEAP